MVREIIMPKLGETMEEGEIIQWLKQEGDLVQQGDLLVEIATDKANMEVECPASGYLRKVLVQPGQNVQVTKTIAYLADSMDEELPDGTQDATSKPERALPAAATSHNEETKTSKRSPIKASPLAKRLARELNLDLSLIHGTGPGGRITKNDILQAGEGKPASAPPGTPWTMSRTEQIVANRMSLSKKEIPHFYLTSEVLFLEAQKLRADLLEEFEEQEGVHLTYTDLIVRACARALRKCPRINAHFNGGKPVLFDEINVGLAIAGEQGLVVPVIHKADKKQVFEIGRERSTLVERALSGNLSLEDIEGGTFTLSNLGMMHITSFCGIINHPQVCLLATGEINNRAVALGEELVIAPVMHMTLSCDHRAVDGYLAAQFLGEVRKGLEKPSLLLI